MPSIIGKFIQSFNSPSESKRSTRQDNDPKIRYETKTGYCNRLIDALSKAVQSNTASNTVSSRNPKPEATGHIKAEQTLSPPELQPAAARVQYSPQEITFDMLSEKEQLLVDLFSDKKNKGAGGAEESAPSPSSNPKPVTSESAPSPSSNPKPVTSSHAQAELKFSLLELQLAAALVKESAEDIPSVSLSDKEKRRADLFVGTESQGTRGAQQNASPPSSVVPDSKATVSSSPPNRPPPQVPQQRSPSAQPPNRPPPPVPQQRSPSAQPPNRPPPPVPRKNI